MNIKNVLEAAILAPSGDNCQPWRIVLEGRRIEVYNVQERDTSLFKFRQMASLVANGALIENVMIAAKALGCSARLTLFPDRMKPHLLHLSTSRNPRPRMSHYFPILPKERLTGRYIDAIQ